MIRFISLVFLLLSVPHFAAAQTGSEKTGVLYIGNAGYQTDASGNAKFDPLKFSSVDVNKMYELFTELKVDKSLDPYLNRESKDAVNINIKTAKIIFSNNNITNVIFYYTGHGIEERDKSFLIPTEFKLAPDLKKLFPYLSPGMQNYISNIQNGCNNISEKKFIDQLNYYNLICNAISIAAICDSFKNFKTMFISDACRNTLQSPQQLATYNAAAININAAYFKNWFKNNGQKKLSTKQANAYYKEFQNISTRILDSVEIFDRQYSNFENTITSKTKRKPLTILQATENEKTASETWEQRGGLFTASFIDITRTDKIPVLVFNEAFVHTLAENMKARRPLDNQVPSIKGSQGFSLNNPSYKKPLTWVQFRNMVSNSLQQYDSAVLSSNIYMQTMGFPERPVTKYYNPVINDSIDAYMHSDTTITVARNSLFDFETKLHHLPENYQVETTLSFAKLNDVAPDQLFYWDGYFANYSAFGYHIIPNKQGNDFYLGFGHTEYFYSQPPFWTPIMNFNLSSFDSTNARQFVKENKAFKITIRRYNNEFFFFINQQFVGRAKDVVKKKWTNMFVSNLVPFAIENEITKAPYTDQLNRGNTITVSPVTIYEIKENTTGYNISND